MHFKTNTYICPMKAKDTSLQSEDKPPLPYYDVNMYKALKVREVDMCIRLKISVQMLNVLVLLVGYYSSGGKDVRLCDLVFRSYGGLSYRVLYNQLTVLCSRGLVYCIKRSDSNTNYFSPTELGIEVINDLLV